MTGDGDAGPATRVVVLDGNVAAGSTAAAVLVRGGFEAVASDDPAATTEAVRSEGVTVVVVGTAVGSTSPATVTALRDHPEPAVRDVSVVALVDDAPGADAALAAGADSVLLRPVEADRLVEAVGDVARLDVASRRARRRHR